MLNRAIVRASLAKHLGVPVSHFDAIGRTAVDIAESDGHVVKVRYYADAKSQGTVFFVTAYKVTTTDPRQK